MDLVLFQYLESFFENGITYKVYAVADSKEIKTNSGIALTVDDVIANLKGHEDEYDARYSLVAMRFLFSSRTLANNTISI